MFSNVLSLISSCLWKGNTFVDFKNCVRLQPEAPNIYKPGITHSHRCGSDSKIWFKELARTSSRWIVNKKNIVFNSVKDFGSKRCPLCPLRLWVSSVFRKEFYFSSLLKPNLNSCQVSNNIRGISWGVIVCLSPQEIYSSTELGYTTFECTLCFHFQVEFTNIMHGNKQYCRSYFKRSHSVFKLVKKMLRKWE